MIQQEKLVEFIRAYVNTFADLSSNVKDKPLIFPEYIASPHRIYCTISKTKGASIEFSESSSDWSTITTTNDDRPIEQVVFDISGQGTPFFSNSAVGSTLRSLNLITQDYYNSNKEIIDVLSRAANLIKDNLNTFIEVKNGDIRLIDVGLAWRKNGINKAKKFLCLWLFADDSSPRISAASGKEAAIRDYQQIVSDMLGGTPLNVLARVLVAYQTLLDNPDTKEEQMQQFLERNFLLLDAGYKKLFTKGDLRGFRMPEVDFLMKTSDSKYVLVELEAPKDPLFTKEKLPNPSKDLRDTMSQMQNYMSDFKNHILSYRETFPDMTSEVVSGLVIIGRSSRLTDPEKVRLRQIVGTTRDYRIITFDELFENSKALLENFALKYGNPR